MDQETLQQQQQSSAPPKAGRASVGESLSRGKDALGGVAAGAMADASSDLEALRNDLAGLKNTLARFMTEAGGEAAKSAREVSSSVAGHVGDTASDLADIDNIVAIKACVRERFDALGGKCGAGELVAETSGPRGEGGDGRPVECDGGLAVKHVGGVEGKSFADGPSLLGVIEGDGCGRGERAGG